MSYKEQYDFWLSDAYFDEATKEELRSIAGNEKEIRNQVSEKKKEKFSVKPYSNR